MKMQIPDPSSHKPAGPSTPMAESSHPTALNPTALDPTAPIPTAPIVQSPNIGPVTQSNRIRSLDLLRGIALLGILIMNIQSFSMPGAAYINPTSYGNLEGINYVVWLLSHIFADQKFMTLFSMLFGAGILLVSDRATAKTGKSAGLHYTRNGLLLMIGLLHAHLIWYGDILVGYALCAFFVYLFRRRKPRTLLILGLLLFAVHTLIYGLFGASLAFLPPEDIADIKISWAPSDELIREEIAAFTGTLASQIRANSGAALDMETFVFFVLFFWRISGLMLIGMALYRWGILTADRSRSFYLRGLAVSVLAGLSLVLFGVMKNTQAGFSMEYSMFFGAQWNYWGSLMMAFGYVCAVMLWSRSGGQGERVDVGEGRVDVGEGRGDVGEGHVDVGEGHVDVGEGRGDGRCWLKQRFEAVGQMALTNYIMQSVIGVMIFFGVGFGFFGAAERWVQMLVVLMVWGLQLWWSKPWLERYRFGPLEWLWRSATYRAWQPMRKVH